RFEMRFIVVSHSQEAIVSDGSTLIVTFDYEKGTKAPVPDWVREACEDAEKMVAKKVGGTEGKK
ncbi:hypothetical protein HDU93_001089, partial [Gonapodya sp. JEL0774]